MRRSWLLPALVFALAALVLVQRAERVGYNTDEGQFISTAQYFELVFQDGALVGPHWDETYWTLTQPPITRYVLGGAIWLSGNVVPRLNLEHRIEEVRGPNRERFVDPRTFTNEHRLAEERRIDRPSSAVLQAARVPMALFGAGAVLLLFLIGRALAGTLAGLVAAAGLLIAPISLTLLPRAHAEAPLVFFILMGMFCGVQAAAHVRTTRASPSVAGDARVATTSGLLPGLAIGLGAATKLPAVLGIAAFGAFSVWTLVLGWLRPAWVDGRAWRWSALAAAVGLTVMIVVNPFMWPDPMARTMAMLQFRQQELVGQRVLNEEEAVPEDPVWRGVLLAQRTFVAEMPLARRIGIPLEAVLAGLGGAALVWRAVSSRRAGGLVGAEAFTLVWVAAFMCGTASNLGLDWQRYYLPTVALGLVLVGVGAEAVVEAARRAIRASRRAPSANATPPPPITTASRGSAG